ncbi:RNA-binding region RNP-1 protein [Salinisphaera shabanensis E1L3A]|uniref:site-specific DNA-methyltransferase (adenine-specific) n=1 Tax=Salinisphaera shabanensis E1L3A TaxID=1033802 RepID=U2FXX8_9GAMM|nr:RNA-binding region RNP-1 protein [Salinisphaera shabanensis E1L3A]
MSYPSQPEVEQFIERWSVSGGSERANYQSFLAELCDLLDVPRPDPARPDNLENAYVFERSLRFTDSEGAQTTNFIDLYKRDCFVCETKQGVEQPGGQDLLSRVGEEQAKYLKQGHGKRGTPAWNKMMKRARGQGERYIRALPAREGRPPFLLVVDVGHVIEVYAEFTRTGGNYTPYPDVRGHRIRLEDLRDEGIRERLRAIWTDPLSLDPARISAAITRDIAEKLGRLARSLERDGHAPEAVASFLMRCLFTMFSEDVGLLPHRSFTDLLTSLRDDLDFLPPSLEQLWKTMDAGGNSIQLKKKLLRFNGGLFAEQNALPLNRDQLELLIESAQADWTNVEPAIFGTLLERALDPAERHKLGAHYTPREYVERLVLPTIVQPLREDWANVEAAASQLEDAGDTKQAVATVEDFLKRLTQIRVLDPACGSGNFLYVTLEHLKRLEGEVLDALDGLGATQTSFEMAGVTVDPHQLLGLEINPRAVAIADIVLWIGYLQWHFRTHGNVLPPEPVLKNFHNIQHRDALIEWDAVEPVLDENGKPVTHWDGRTTKPHPVTGKEVPDETARRPEQRYIGVRQAEWPAADFIIGNPPFIGTSRMRAALGDGYTEAVRATYKALPESCDFVMYWWHKAAELARNGDIRRFGFIATNSLRQTFNRRVIEPHLAHKKPLSILWAIPDHPWVDAGEGAAVRISMTVGAGGEHHGRLKTVANERKDENGLRTFAFTDELGKLHANLSAGLDIDSAVPLIANSGLSAEGIKPHGKGFLVDSATKTTLTTYPHDAAGARIRPYRNGADINQRNRNLAIIDVDNLSLESLRADFPSLFQHLSAHVKPAREQNRTPERKKFWWKFGRRNTELRNFLEGLESYFVTVKTSKHRTFVSLHSKTLPDSKLIVFGLSTPHFLGILSSNIHCIWALASGSKLGVGNDPTYVKSKSFETFPFPAPTDSQKQRIGELAEQLDAHRKKQLAAHPKLTLTGMYNVLEKLRAGETLTAKDKTIHEQGLVSVLAELHDELDAAVADAYGWPADLTDEQILERLLALNLERAAEERAGHIRWLRPDYQNPDGKSQGAQAEIAVAVQADAAKTSKQKLPDDLPGRFAAVRAALAQMPEGAKTEGVAAAFKGARRNRVAEILDTLVGLGQLQQDPNGVYRL